MEQTPPTPKPRPRPRKSLMCKEENIMPDPQIESIPPNIFSNESAKQAQVQPSILYQSYDTDYNSMYGNYNYPQKITNPDSYYMPAKEIYSGTPLVPPRRSASQGFDLMPNDISQLRTELLTLIDGNSPQAEIKAMVLRILKFDGDFNDKYDMPLKELLKKNEDTSIKKIIIGLTILGKYAVNLLKDDSERPQSWYRINFSSKGFQNIRPLVGNLEILENMGYTMSIQNAHGKTDAVAFGEHKKPNRKKVESITLDLCIARYEMEEISSGKHPQLKKLKEVDGLPNVFFMKTDSMGEMAIPGDEDCKNQPTHALLLSNYPRESEVITSQMFTGSSSGTEIGLYRKYSPQMADCSKICGECQNRATGNFCSNCGNVLGEKSPIPSPASTISQTVSKKESDTAKHAPAIPAKVLMDVKSNITPNIYTRLSPKKSSDFQTRRVTTEDVKVEASKGQWKCNHCTFLNTFDTKICEICLKTSWVFQPPPELSDQRKSVEKETNAEIPAATPNLPKPRDKTQREKGERIPVDSKSPKPNSSDLPDSDSKEKTGTVSSLVKNIKNIALKLGISTPPPNTVEMDFIKSNEIESFIVVDNTNDKKSQEVSSSEEPLTDKEKIYEIYRQKQEAIESARQKQLEEEEKQRKIALEKEKEQERIETEKLIKLFQIAEKNDFSVDECNVGVLALGDAADEHSILVWLRTTWEDIITATTKVCNERLNPTGGEKCGLVPELLVKKYLIKLEGSQKNVVEKVVNIRKEQCARLMQRYEKSFPREVLINTLTETKGSLKESRKKLDRMLLGDFTKLTKLKYDEKKVFEMLKNENTPTDIKCVILLGEEYVDSWGVGENICKLIREDFDNAEVSDYIEAGNSSLDLKMCKKYLKHECIACYSNFPFSKIVTSTACNCELCQTCFITSLKVSITTDNIENLKCQFCNTNIIFSHLEFQIRHYVKEGSIEKKCLEIFSTKLLDKSIADDPNFRYCVHCNNGYGFLWTDDNNKMLCNQCHGYSCFNCKKKWTDEHEGLTCEQYEQYLFLNENKGDEKDVATLFDRTQIDCPSCKAQFELARGGCMHFTCNKCKFQFCGGCSQQFVNSKKEETTPNCDERCKPSGLHTHHPRDCFYYLRDFDVHQLQEVLKKKEIPFETEVSEDRKDQAIACNVNEMKEEQIEQDGKKVFRHYDEFCGSETEKGQAGLCKQHYKEYLGILINRYGLDPIEIYTLAEITNLHRRHRKKKPDKNDGEDEEDYRERLVELTKIDIPLPKRKTMMHPKQVAEMRQRMQQQEQIAINDGGNVFNSSVEISDYDDDELLHY